MVKMQQPILSAVKMGLLLLAIMSGAGAVSLARDNGNAPQALYVFGDSFGDTGNIPHGDTVDESSRQWFHPYGVSSQEADGSGRRANATGRRSDFFVQTDFVAEMLGLPFAPPTYQSSRGLSSGPSGMVFAFAGTGVTEHISFWIHLSHQVDAFNTMVKNGAISQSHVANSVALIAASGGDYMAGFGSTTGFDEITDFIEKVTAKIAANVERLRSLGVAKVLVNNLHPLGCTPSRCRASGYRACDGVSNAVAQVHNTKLEEKLGAKEGVFILDLNSAFNNIVDQFKQKREPCCLANWTNGYCGQMDFTGQPMYRVCDDPNVHLFWDDLNPTHAGWKALMAQLQDPVKRFIGGAETSDM